MPYFKQYLNEAIQQARLNEFNFFNPAIIGALITGGPMETLEKNESGIGPEFVTPEEHKRLLQYQASYGDMRKYTLSTTR